MKVNILLLLVLLSSNIYGQYRIDRNKIIETAVLLEFVSSNKSGTGFFLTKKTDTIDYLYLVTARHVLGTIDSNSNLDLFAKEMQITYTNDIYSNSQSKVAIDLSILKDKGLLKYSIIHDLAVVLLGRIVDNNIEYLNFANFNQIDEMPLKSITPIYEHFLLNFDDVVVGNDAFISGYPKALGLSQQPQYDYNNPLIRRGIIAGISQLDKTIVVDCPAFGGNSGGPLFMIKGSKPPEKPKWRLAGIVIEYIPALNGFNTQNSGYLLALSIEPIEDLLGQFKL